MASSALDVSRATLDRVPGRALTFLRGAATSPQARSQLAAYGYTDADHAEGWRLLMGVAGFKAPSPAPAPDGELRIRQAIADIDAWDDGTFRRARAALGRLHPAQGEFVFHELEASTGAQAILGVETFLDRIDALESAPSRKATRKADHAAIATLARRGITPAERARMRGLLAIARSSPEVPQVDAAATAALERRDDQLRALLVWLEDWSETARTVIVRRDLRIRLGLAKRKRIESALAPADPNEPANDNDPPQSGVAV